MKELTKCFIDDVRKVMDDANARMKEWFDTTPVGFRLEYSENQSGETVDLVPTGTTLPYIRHAIAVAEKYEISYTLSMNVAGDRPALSFFVPNYL